MFIDWLIYYYIDTTQRDGSYQIIYNGLPSWVRHVYNTITTEKYFEAKFVCSFTTSEHTKCYNYLSVSVMKPASKYRSDLVGNCCMTPTKDIKFLTIQQCIKKLPFF